MATPIVSTWNNTIDRMKPVPRTLELLVTRPPKLPPVHPGEILKEDVLPALGLSVTEAARRLGVTRQTLHRILSASHGVTPEMALRLGKFCGNEPGLWLRMQQAYDLWQAKRRLGKALDRIPTWRTGARISSAGAP